VSRTCSDSMEFCWDDETETSDSLDKMKEKVVAGARNQQYRPLCTWWPRDAAGGVTAHGRLLGSERYRTLCANTCAVLDKGARALTSPVSRLRHETKTKAVPRDRHLQHRRAVRRQLSRHRRDSEHEWRAKPHDDLLCEREPETRKGAPGERPSRWCSVHAAERLGHPHLERVMDHSRGGRWHRMERDPRLVFLCTRVPERLGPCRSRMDAGRARPAFARVAIN